MRFRADQVEELLTYLRFKLPLLVPGSKVGDDLPDRIKQHVHASMSRQGEVTVNKSDAIFRCWSPSCR